MQINSGSITVLDFCPPHLLSFFLSLSPLFQFQWVRLGLEARGPSAAAGKARGPSAAAREEERGIEMKGGGRDQKSNTGKIS